MSVTTNPHDGGTHGGPTNPHAGLVDPAAIKRGHEADSYDNKSVLSVPLLVVVFFLLAFGTVTIVFYFVSKTVVDPNANPLAVEENSGPLNERLGKIHRTEGGPSDQPRLEPLTKRKGDPRAITEPKTETGNSPELHPEDIRVSAKNTPELFEKKGPVKGTPNVSHIPIDLAMKLVLHNNFLPADKKGTEPPKSTNIPTAANAGRGRQDSPEEGVKK